ncbi:hypothetical protein [Microbispora sp. GKU 823]|uniref:hypothetical protein n=1 Tax=Microbispora sp. GKU 823 TaxID=1652100 RepID=UPI00117F43A1|nr:hypothetical protein [Microbispora sp. GKU 823]
MTYTCTPGAGGTAVTHDFTVTLTASTSTVTGTQYTASLSIQPLTTSEFPAPVQIASGAAIELQPSVSASALPAGMTAGVSTPSPTGAALTSAVAAQASMPPLPVATLTVTPSAGATSVVLTAKDFKISMVAPAGTGTTTTPTLLYNCVVATTGANTAPAVATIPVTNASASPSASASASASPSASASASTSPTPRNTRTVYETVFASPTPKKTKTKSAQVENTPGGGAATGGGGDAGPDARLFVLTGTALMLAAGAGGLVLRTRRRPVRQ